MLIMRFVSFDMADKIIDIKATNTKQKQQADN